MSNTQARRDARQLWADPAVRELVRVSPEPSAGQLNFGAGRTAMYVSDGTALSFQEGTGQHGR